MMSRRKNYLSQDRREYVKIGDLFAIRYYLKYYNISLTPAVEKFMSQSYEKGYEPSLYEPKENCVLKNLIYLILYSNPKPILELIRTERKKLDIYESLNKKKHDNH
jgi:hypothetical protein